jgi:hypothetical protein
MLLLGLPVYVWQRRDQLNRQALAAQLDRKPAA